MDVRDGDVGQERFGAADGWENDEFYL